MVKYKHVLALNPYFGDSTAAMGVFPPTGLEYIAASMKDLVGKVTLLDLRYEKAYQDPQLLSAFIRNEVDLLCISIRWESQFKKICDFVSQLPVKSARSSEATKQRRKSSTCSSVVRMSAWSCAVRAKRS